MSDLVERLRSPSYWKSSDGYSEAFDSAPVNAAAHIEAQEAELSKARMELITAGCEWQELAEKKQAVEAECARLREALAYVRQHLGDPVPISKRHIARRVEAALSPVLIEDGK